MTAQAFSHRIPDAALADLHARLAATRLPLDEANDWTAGTNPTYLRELLDYWRTRFDWRAIERQLHQLSHHVATLSGTRIHFIYERGRGPAPLPLLLTHGFPDSFARFIKLIPLLTAPADRATRSMSSCRVSPDSVSPDHRTRTRISFTSRIAGTS